MKEQIEELSKVLANQSLVASLSKVATYFPGRVCFSSAFGQEDQVITDAIFSNHLAIDIFTLDTGRLFKETYELIDKTRARYGKTIKVYYPDTQRVQDLVSEKGMHSFYESVENRKECCFIRKVEPLGRALKGADVWITGLRAEQSDNRQHSTLLEWDEAHQVIKFNPLLHWSFREVLTYLEENDVPYNTLHDKGFPSIGCAPCTRAVQHGEHSRSGRWWWEQTQKECGLHAIK